MRSPRLLTVGALLSASITGAAAADGAWEIMALADGVTPAAIPGIDGAVWVPNSWNNPTIDLQGRVCFRGQIAGPGITNTGATANHLAIVQGTPGNWVLLARNNSLVPGNTPAGAVISRTASPNNSLVTANNITDDGGVILSGYMTGTGITAGTNDTAMWFQPNSGAPVLIAQGRDACPGTAGALFPANMTAGSGLRTNSGGRALFYAALTGGDTVTANNAAVVLIGPGDDQLVMRKGDAAPGLPGFTVTPDSFGQFLNGGAMVFSGKLVGAGVTTANDSVYLTNIGLSSGLRIFAREGDPIPGLKGLTFANTSSLSFGQRPIASDGTISFIATLGGSATALDNIAIMTELNGVFSIQLRKGAAIPGITDSASPDFAGKVFQGPNNTGNCKSRNGLFAFEGIIMNADGSAISSPAPNTFVGALTPGGSVVTICRQSDSVPGLTGWAFGGLNGSTSICVSDNGTVVFSASMSNATTGETGNALMAWDAAAGLRLLAKASQQGASPFTPTGDTVFTGTPCNQITLIGSTGNNGDGGGTGLSSSGWLTVRAGDTASGIYAIARIKVGPTSNPCPADLNGDGSVSAADLASLLSGWGGASPDLNGDGVVNAADLSVLLSAWGPCQ